MAASADELRKNEKIQIPLIDLRGFCQDELIMIARLSGDIAEPQLSSMIRPKIDKTIFNESAGSRRQTYYGHRVPRKRKKLDLESDASEACQGISMRSIMKYSARGKSGSNKKSGRDILDLANKLLHIMDKEDANLINGRDSLSSIVSEKTDVPKLAHIDEHKRDDQSHEVLNANSYNKCEEHSYCINGVVGTAGRDLGIGKVKSVQGSQEDQNDIVVNVR
ncbi:uncharacterized protein LOC131052846 [Cryptomeria japonica]|uniref:uncharacterized protein LOC131052846 n=1 Tax=Cryptomeria japonica TaxID=3369 RepID=UPI0027DA1A19|nr:uncharacterized protein LOC131052846 [Cryptomeria japonica]